MYPWLSLILSEYSIWRISWLISLKFMPLPADYPHPLLSRLGQPLKALEALFGAKDIHALADPEAHLNDVCVNSCAVLLYSELIEHKASHIAIFSTHDLPCIRYQASDEDLWHSTSQTKFWEKSVWILPIHQPLSWGHWVLLLYLMGKVVAATTSARTSCRCAECCH